MMHMTRLVKLERDFSRDVRATYRVAKQPAAAFRAHGLRAFRRGTLGLSKQPAHQPYQPGKNNQPEDEPENPNQNPHRAALFSGGKVSGEACRARPASPPHVVCRGKLRQIRGLSQQQKQRRVTN
jgi:hypothetical protein